MSGPNLNTVTQQILDDLWDDYLKLQALENAGVDNWDWYDTAMENYREMKEDANS